MHTCYLELGSNTGSREMFIETAIKKINSILNTSVTERSSIIETDPVGYRNQGKFLNTAIKIKTGLSCRELLNNLHMIENELGRVRTIKNGPRTIDIDILIFDDQHINEVDLIVPHPRMAERDFVLKTLGEIAPEITDKFINEKNKHN